MLKNGQDITANTHIEIYTIPDTTQKLWAANLMILKTSGIQ
jgi:hypothetical protein